MNDPRYEALEQRVKRLEQATEPVQVTRIEIDPGIQTRLDNHAEMLKEHGEQLTLIYTDVGHMKADIGTLKGDVSTLKQTVARLETKVDKGFQAVEKRFDAIAEVQKLILARLPEKGGE